MGINDKFLESYRQLETELRTDNMSVLDYENSLVGIEQEKLKVCRIMRNYLSHNDVTFLSTSNNQTKFIEECIASIRKSAHTVKDELNRIKLTKSTEPIKNILPIIDKHSIAPIDTNKGLYIVTKDILIHQLAQGNKKLLIPSRLPKYLYTSKTERIENLAEGIYIVTSDGTASGVYQGICIK